MTQFMPLPPLFLDRVTDEDRFIVCFPRSGFRWLRLLLTDLINNRQGVTSLPIYEVAMARELQKPQPAVECFDDRNLAPNPYHEPVRACTLPDLGIKPLYKSHDISSLVSRGNHLVYLFRSPIPSLVSYYHFARERGYNADTTINEFALQTIGQWIDHVNFAISLHRNAPERIRFIHYQECGPFDSAQLNAVTHYLEFESDPLNTEPAITNLRQFLGRLNKRSEMRHSRGGNSAANSELSRRTIRRIERQSGTTYRQAIEISQRQLQEIVDHNQIPNTAGELSVGGTTR